MRCRAAAPVQDHRAQPSLVQVHVVQEDIPGGGADLQPGPAHVRPGSRWDDPGQGQEEAHPAAGGLSTESLDIGALGGKYHQGAVHSLPPTISLHAYSTNHTEEIICEKQDQEEEGAAREVPAWTFVSELHQRLSSKASRD